MVSCNITQAPDCFQATGENIKTSQELAFFNTVVLNDNIDLYLHNGASNYAEIEGGQNLLPEIKLEIKDSILTISNQNSCNWVRDFDKRIKVYLGIENVTSMTYQGYGNIQSIEKLKKEEFYLLMLEASGDVNLAFESEYIGIYSNCVASLNLQGTSTSLRVFTQGLGKISAENLQTNFVDVEHNGQNEVKVLPKEKLTVLVRNTGNTAYYTNPNELIITQKGSGKVFFKQ